MLAMIFTIFTWYCPIKFNNGGTGDNQNEYSLKVNGDMANIAGNDV